MSEATKLHEYTGAPRTDALIRELPADPALALAAALKLCRELEKEVVGLLWLTNPASGGL